MKVKNLVDPNFHSFRTTSKKTKIAIVKRSAVKIAHEKKSRNSHFLKTATLLLKLFHKSWPKWAIKIPETNKFRLN